jgi:hypothetical protein
MDVLTLGMMDFILEWEQDTAFSLEKVCEQDNGEEQRWAIDALRLKRVDALMMQDSTYMPKEVK